MILLKDRALIFAKESEYYSIHFYRKAQIPTTIIRPEEDSIMYLYQSRQISNLKKSIMTANQQHRRGTQMLASVLSSKVSQ